MAVRGVRSRFRKDELILCFEPDSKKARVLYEAKILEVRFVRKKSGTRVPEYLIHFNGWSSTWDRRLGEAHLLKLTPENSSLAKKLREVARGIRTNNARKRKIDDILNQVLKKGKRRELERACLLRGSNAGTETESRSSGNATEDSNSGDNDDEGTLSAGDDESRVASPGGGRNSDRSDAGSNGRIESADGTNTDDEDDDDATTTSSRRQTLGRHRRQQPHGRKGTSRNGDQSEEDESRDGDEGAEEEEDEETETTVLYTGPPESAPRLELPLPPNLRKVLVADYHQVRRMAAKRQQQQQRQATAVPVHPTVLTILELFLDDFARHTAPLPSTEVAAPSTLSATKAPSVSPVRDPLPPCAETRLRLAEEVAEGVRVLFDCTLPLILLYASERQEYEDLFVACTAERNDAAASTNDLKNQCASPSPSQVGADLEPDAGATASASVLTTSLIGRLTRPPISTCTANTAASVATPATVTPATMPSSPRHCLSANSTVEARALRHASLRSHGPAAATSTAVTTTSSAAESGSSKDHVHDLHRRTRAEVNHVHRGTSDNGDYGIDTHHAATSTSGAAHGESPSQQQQPAIAAAAQYPVPDALLLLPPQYRSAKPPLPCTVYGLPHLLRLLLSLPELVSRMQITPEKCSTVQFILQKFVRYLSEESAALLPVAASQHHN